MVNIWSPKRSKHYPYCFTLMAPCRVDDEDDEMGMNDEDIEKLVIVTRVRTVICTLTVSNIF